MGQCQRQRTVTTHSATLEFPNGDVVEIPAPNEADGWEDCGKSDIDGAWRTEYFLDSGLITERTVVHDCGWMILKEYMSRANEEDPKILKYRKWTRTVTPELPNEPDMYDAFRNFPLLMGWEYTT